jgi:hypothetical protein
MRRREAAPVVNAGGMVAMVDAVSSGIALTDTYFQAIELRSTPPMMTASTWRFSRHQRRFDEAPASNTSGGRRE